MSEETPAAESLDRVGAPEPRLPASENPKTSTTEPSESGSHEDRDGPVSESDALRSLTEGAGHDEAERSEALRAGAIADLIAQRLNSDASGTRIGTLALFNDSVSFGGGFNSGGSRPGATRTGSTSVLPMDAVELVEYTELFIQPENYDDCLESLSNHRLLVLTGAPGSGRVAAAVNLLGEAMALGGTGDGGCHRLLDPAVVLEPGWTPPVKNCGYLAVLEDGPAGIGEFAVAFGMRTAVGPGAGVRQLAAVVSALRASDCHLVLTGGHDLAVAAAGPGGESVALHHLPPVDPLVLVERRVLGHEGGNEAYADLRQLLESTGARDALREQPAAQHAVRLAGVITSGGDVAAAVGRLRDPSSQVRAWFDRYREPEALSFALSAAVLEDSSYLTVADAAVKLCTALTPPELAPPDLRFRDRLGHEQQWIRLDFTDTAAPRVGFRSPLLGQVILAYAWGTLDGRRAAFLDWLRVLLRHSDLEVRARAAVAAGVLAWADHRYAVHRFLTTWAGSTSWPLRQAAATALGVAGSHPESAGAVWELLHRWAGGGTSAYQRRLAGTAANSVGGVLGRNSPHQAVAVLRTALDHGEDWGTLPSVAWGGLHLIHQGQAQALLDGYLEWSQPQDLSPMVAKSLSAFVFAVSQPYEQPADGTEEQAGVPGVPLLLSDLDRHRHQLAELWSRALARRPVQDSALAALREWIDTYPERCPGSLDAIGELLADIASRPGRHHERLLWWLKKWANDGDRPSANAAALRRMIDQP